MRTCYLFWITLQNYNAFIGYLGGKLFLNTTPLKLDWWYIKKNPTSYYKKQEL